MRRFLGIWALLVAPAFAQDEPKEPPPPPEPRVAELVGGGLTTRRRDGPAVRVRLHSGGQLQYRTGKEWTNATLAGLREFLERARRAHDAELREKGESGFEKIPGAPKGISKLFLAVEAEPNTPWQHIQWLMAVAAESRFWKLDLSDGKRHLLVCLPVDRGARKAPEDAPPEILVGVHVLARAEKAARWGGGMVSRPTRFLYRAGNRQTADLATVAKWVRDGKKAAAADGAVLRGHIEAGHKVPFARILELMRTFVDEGLPAVRLEGHDPDAEIRKAERLPYPVKNYDTPD